MPELFRPSFGRRAGAAEGAETLKNKKIGFFQKETTLRLTSGPKSYFQSQGLLPVSRLTFDPKTYFRSQSLLSVPRLVFGPKVYFRSQGLLSVPRLN